MKYNIKMILLYSLWQMFMKQIAINKKVLIKSPTFITWTPAGDVLLMNRSWTKYLLRLSKYFPKNQHKWT